MNEFNVDDFLKGLEKDKPKQNEDRIKKILMNAKQNQGTILFLPYLNKVNNNFYIKLDNVREWVGSTTRLDSGEAWYRILEKDLYKDLTKAESKLYDDVSNLYDQVLSKDVYDYDQLRIRKYSLLYGILLSHVDIAGNELSDNVGRACLFIFPTDKPIDSLLSSIKTKCQSIGSNSWVTKIMSPTDTGREGALSVTFKKSAGPGYDCSMSIEVNSQFTKIIDPNLEHSKESIDLFDDPVRDLLGWQGGDDGRYFNTEVFEELKKDLIITLNTDIVTTQPITELVNKNGSQDPMKVSTDNDLPF